MPQRPGRVGFDPVADADRADVVARAVGAGAVGLLLPGLDEASLPLAMDM